MRVQFLAMEKQTIIGIWGFMHEVVSQTAQRGGGQTGENRSAQRATTYRVTFSGLNGYTYTPVLSTS